MVKLCITQVYWIRFQQNAPVLTIVYHHPLIQNLSQRSEPCPAMHHTNNFLGVCLLVCLTVGIQGTFSENTEPILGNTERRIQASLSELKADKRPTSFTSLKIDQTRSDGPQFDAVKLQGGDYASEIIAKSVAYVRVSFDSRHPVPCTGTFLSDTLVMTAAECFEGENQKFDISKTLVRVGQVNQNQQWYSAKLIHTLNNYDPNTLFNNIAIVSLSERIQEPISIVRIPPPTFEIREVIMSVAEFERKCPDGRAEFRVKYVDLRHYSSSSCQAFWTTQGNSNWDATQILCARKTATSNTESGSICLERGGAPLFRHQGRAGLVQYGISSSIRSTKCRGQGIREPQWFVNLKTHKQSIVNFSKNRLSEWRKVFDVDELPPRNPTYG